MPRLPHRPLLLAICLALPLAACSDDPAETASADDTIATTTTEPDSTTGSTTSTAAEPDLTPEQEVEAAYLIALKSHYARLQKPDPDDPEISDLHTGASYERVVARNRELSDSGQAARLTSRGLPTPTIQSVDLTSASEAIVLSCYVDDVVIYFTATNEVVNDDVESVTIESVLQFEEGRWKVAENLMVATVPGPAGCVA